MIITITSIIGLILGLLIIIRGYRRRKFITYAIGVTTAFLSNLTLINIIIHAILYLSYGIPFLW